MDEDLLKVLTMIRLMVAVRGGSTALLESCISTLLATIREYHPGRRDYMLWSANCGRILEAQVRLNAKRFSG